MPVQHTPQLLRSVPYFPVAGRVLMEEFAVRDRKGYVLGFGQALAAPAPGES